MEVMGATSDLNHTELKLVLNEGKNYTDPYIREAAMNTMREAIPRKVEDEFNLSFVNVFGKWFILLAFVAVFAVLSVLVLRRIKSERK